MTQCDEIMEFMEQEGPITPMDALREFGCMRLASRISDLKRRGVKIKKTMVTRRNYKGEVKRFASYELEE